MTKEFTAIVAQLFVNTFRPLAFSIPQYLLINIIRDNYPNFLPHNPWIVALVFCFAIELVVAQLDSRKYAKEKGLGLGL